MTVFAPFAYPISTHQRRHAPAGYRNYQSYKPWLRDEFTFRCVYCLERERWYPSRAAAFSVDHVIPQIVDPTRICDYENLVYACLRCNSIKQSRALPDPTQTCFAECLSIDEDGTILALNSDGKNLIDILHLNELPILETRRNYLKLANLKLQYPNDPEVRNLFLNAFGYPNDLPNLTAKKMRGGAQPKSGRAVTYYQLRQQNQLDEVY